MEQRDFQPSLFWAKCESWYMGQLEQPPMQPYRPHDLTIYVYRSDTTGAYMLNGPKMYWQDEPMSGEHFNNINQDDMFNKAVNLGEVVIWDRKLRKTVLVGKTYEQAIQKIDKTESA